MASTKYKEIYGRVITKLTDFDFAIAPTEEIESILSQYMDSAIVRFKFCKQSFEDKDDEKEDFNIDLTLEEKEILAGFVLLEYISSNYMVNPEVLKNELPSKDFSAFSKANFGGSLLNFHRYYKNDFNALLSRYTYSSGGLFAKK